MLLGCGEYSVSDSPCSTTQEQNAVALDIAKRAAERIWKLAPQSASAYVVMGNIYATTGNKAEEARVRRAMKKQGIKKIPGQTWIEVKDIVHSFTAGQNCSEDVHAELTKLWEELKEAGHEPDTRWVTWDEEEEEKAERLCFHSEKLAIAFGLVHTPPGTPLMITKNLRVCPDCHEATKMIAKLRGRLIVVRDANRFHHFHTDGSCSCGDYW